MIYPILVTIALLCVWGTAAYMSVCGMVAVFGGHAVVTVFLASGMELAKLMLILHLHRAWRRMGPGARVFYIAVILALVAVTAIEATGFLIESHTRDTAPISVDRTILAGLTAETQALQRHIDTIDATLAHLPEGYVSRRLAEREAAGYDRMQAELSAKLSAMHKISVEIARAETQASPIVTIARITGADPSRTLIAFVLLLVCIIEPLSVGLAVAVSSAWICRRPKHAEKATAETGREQEIEAAETGRTEKTEAPETEQQPEIIQTAETGRDLPGDFAEIVNRHRLTAEKLAKITGRAKLKTVEQWLDGTVEIPIKALRELRRWQETQPRLSLVTR